MATKSKKFKHTLFSKGLCLILSAVMFFSAAYSAIVFFQSLIIFGPEDYLNGNDDVSFYNTLAFKDEFASDAYKISQLADSNISVITSVIDSQAEATVNAAVESYLTKKAAIIKSELEYAVENYDESYFNYEYTAELVTIPESQTIITEEVSTSEETTTVNIPKNVEAAKKILETAEGKDFLNYEALVRSDAFDYDFSYTADIYYNQTIDTSASYQTILFIDNLKYSESQIKKQFYAQYNSEKQSFINDLTYDTYSNKYELEELMNFRYYAEDSQGTVYTNIDGDFNVAYIINHDIYAYFDGKDIVIHGFADDKDTTGRIKNILTLSNGKCVYIYMEDVVIGDTAESDIYRSLYDAYYECYDLSAVLLITVFIVSLVMAIILLVAFACACGHKNDFEYPVLALIDKVPTDIHFILSFGIIAAGCIFGYILINDTILTPSNPYEFFGIIKYAVTAIAVACWFLLSEWIASVARIKKCGYSFFKRTLIAKFVSWNCRGFRKLKDKIIKVFSYKPKVLTAKAIIMVIGYAGINIALILFAIGGYYFVSAGEIALLSIIVMIIFNSIVAYFSAKYVKMLDLIIAASCEHKEVDFGAEKAPDSLALLANNLTNTNAELERAVAQAVKDEQMKTELITNVSHDLKTPLTSLITYSDLLSKCDITDESAIKYTDVIHRQSIKLKRLIEDLIEASKVSSGNVTLNMSILNLSELAIQATVEYAPETEKNGNEIVFNEPDNAPKVIADSAKTYRIISNLLSNAKKYSAPDTRIYVSVYTDGVNGYFEVKNISNEPLNISPDELTERFVRGDKSRSKEGNGLGLAIAKDLCTLQNGELKLIIDGDLFKAIVKLPCKQEEQLEQIIEQSTEDTTEA